MDQKRLIRINELAIVLWDETTEQWHPEGKWPSLLAEHCSADRELADDVAAFVHASQKSPEDLRLSIPLPFEESATTDPAVIGRYSIVRRIGTGGMGVVYEARQIAEDVELPVAVKLIKVGFDTELFVRRFRTERLVLSRLLHKNIVRILDAGSTPEGRPFFAMELVEGGVPIDTFCRLNKLTLEARLKLFSVVCEAVQFAHDNGVLHRDLKPSNVLVDKHGELRLLDFGLASLQIDNDQKPSFARSEVFAVRVGTEEYIAPEVKNGEPASVASEIYSLGVTLRVILRDVEAPRTLLAAVEETIERAVNADPGARHKSVKELAGALATAMESTPLPVSRDATGHVARSKVTWLVALASFGLFTWFVTTRVTTRVENELPKNAASNSSASTDVNRQPTQTAPILKTKNDAEPSKLSAQVDVSSALPFDNQRKEQRALFEELRALEAEQQKNQLSDEACTAVLDDYVSMAVSGKLANKATNGSTSSFSTLRQQADEGSDKAQSTYVFLTLNIRGMAQLAKQRPGNKNFQTSRCLERIVTTEDYEKALGWLRARAKTVPAAATYLAMVLKSPTWGTTNPWEAYMWAKRAADAGFPAGHSILAECYWDGQGAPRNIAAAISEWKKAAVMDEQHAQIALAEKYESGEAEPHLPRDYGRAYFWLMIAASNPQTFLIPGKIDNKGFGKETRENCAAKLPLVRKQLSPEQVSALEAEAAEWFKQHRPLHFIEQTKDQKQ